MEYKFEMDHLGNFIIEVDGHKSNPAGYNGIASVNVAGKTYIGVSDYYGGILPTECVVEIITHDVVKVPQDKDSIHSLLDPNKKCNCVASEEEIRKIVGS